MHEQSFIENCLTKMYTNHNAFNLIPLILYFQGNTIEIILLYMDARIHRKSKHIPA